MEQDLQSSISYAGGRKVADLKHVDYVIVRILSGMVTLIKTTITYLSCGLAQGLYKVPEHLTISKSA